MAEPPITITITAAAAKRLLVRLRWSRAGVGWTDPAATVYLEVAAAVAVAVDGVVQAPTAA